ncbi:helix-turn-helix domain-containing protein [Methylosinus sp. PW1]|uniref:helix-turn-helix domain-containing protein n=1 Tax=Methylosinus sp. PW1 TaxID=107636 RepID=UPI00056D4467|nr:helix-turn-helix domain-containing protein [Methylosinus sp. PW1]
MAKSKGVAGGNDDSLGDDPFLVEIGRRVKQIRTDAGMTQKDLGEAAGSLSSSYIYLVERGRQNMTLTVFRRVAEALGVPIEDLLSDTDRDGQLSDRSLTRFVYQLEKLGQILNLRREQDDAIFKELENMSAVKERITEHLKAQKKGGGPSR